MLKYDDFSSLQHYPDQVTAVAGMLCGCIWKVFTLNHIPVTGNPD